MTIFFDDRPLFIENHKKARSGDSSRFDAIYDLRLTALGTISMAGHVLILNATSKAATEIAALLKTAAPVNLLSITLYTQSYQEVTDAVKSLFKMVKAAGGVVLKNDLYLLIFRRKKWDLPKGKLDKGEKSRDAALRELREETGVKAMLRDKILTTYHTYVENGNSIMKRTKWYLMENLSDAKMGPQLEEGIERVLWCTAPEVDALLVNSYSSVRYVIAYLRLNFMLIEKSK